MGIEELREKLNYVINIKGVKARHISLVTGISESLLSRFRKGERLLGYIESRNLQQYFDNNNF